MAAGTTTGTATTRRGDGALQRVRAGCGFAKLCCRSEVRAGEFGALGVDLEVGGG